MRDQPIGTLSNGKKYYLRTFHPDHRDFTKQEHEEAAKLLYDKGFELKSEGMDNDDGLGVQLGITYMMAANWHHEQAKKKG
jgi:hypothetical protein